MKSCCSKKSERSLHLDTLCVERAEGDVFARQANKNSQKEVRIVRKHTSWLSALLCAALLFVMSLPSANAQGRIPTVRWNDSSEVQQCTPGPISATVVVNIHQEDHSNYFVNRLATLKFSYWDGSVGFYPETEMETTLISSTTAFTVTATMQELLRGGAVKRVEIIFGASVANKDGVYLDEAVQSFYCEETRIYLPLVAR